LWRERNDSTLEDFSVEVGIKEYSVSESHYEESSRLNETFLEFKGKSSTITDNTQTWQYSIGLVSNDYKKTEAVFQKAQTRIFITATEKTTLEFTDF
jgi:hypothetical protein